MAKNKEQRIFPLECRCHPLAYGETTVVMEGGELVPRKVARLAVRSVFCSVHQPHRYLPRFISAEQTR